MQVIFSVVSLNLIGVGKTSILMRYTKNKFTDDYKVTVGAEFGSRTISIDETTKIKLQIWDTVIT
jgi:GTPase SAR1 family protein